MTFDGAVSGCKHGTPKAPGVRRLVSGAGLFQPVRLCAHWCLRSDGQTGGRRSRSPGQELPLHARAGSARPNRTRRAGAYAGRAGGIGPIGRPPPPADMAGAARPIRPRPARARHRTAALLHTYAHRRARHWPHRTLNGEGRRRTMSIRGSIGGRRHCATALAATVICSTIFTGPELNRAGGAPSPSVTVPRLDWSPCIPGRRFDCATAARSGHAELRADLGELLRHILRPVITVKYRPAQTVPPRALAAALSASVTSEVRM